MTESQPSLQPIQALDTPSKSAPPRVWPSVLSPFAAIILAVVFQIVMAVVLVFILMGQGTEPDQLSDKIMDSMTDPPVFILTLVLGQVAFAIVALLAGYLSPEPLRQRLAFPPNRASGKIYLLTMLGSIFVLALAMSAAYGMTLVVDPDGSVEGLFSKMTIGWLIPFCLLIAFLPGFIEEILFRGYIQTRFLKRWSPPAAIALSSILFAIAHVSPHAIALALILGVWLGYIAYRSGSIGPGIACHAFVNGGLNVWRMIAKFGEIPETTQYIVSGVAVAIGLVCFFLAIIELRKLPKPDSPTVLDDEASEVGAPAEQV